MSAIDQVLANNRGHAERFEGGELPAPPALGLAVLACMDARIDVHRILGLRDGDAHVIRNAGGVVTDDEVRSLAISQRRLGTREIMLIHHTDCGMLGLSEEDFRAELRRDVGAEPEWGIEAFDDLDENVRRSMAVLRASPFLPHRDHVRGFVYDVGTGRLREVA